MESAVQPTAKSDIEKLAKFEEFRQKREKEKLERLERIELRKKQLRDRRLTDIQRPHVGLHSIPTTGSAKQQRRTIGTARPPSTVSSTIRPTQTLNGKSQDVPFRPVKSGSTAKRQNVGESSRRATISSQILPLTAKKGNKENLKPKGVLSSSDKEKRWSALGTSSKASNPVKRRLPMSHLGSVKKPCPEANGNVVKQNQIQKANTLRKPETTKHATARYVLHKDSKPASKINLNKVEGLKPDVQVVKKEQEKQLSRERELELWRQKKQQQATDINARPSSSSAFPRRGPSLPSKPGVKPTSSSVRTSVSSVRTSFVKAPASFPTRVKADVPSGRIDKPITVGSKVGPMVMQAKSRPSSRQQNQALSSKEQSAKGLAKTLPELESESHKPPMTLETIFSEPCTPEAKPPRMSTPYSNRCVASPGNALALSSILGSKRKNFISSFTPKTPKTPHSALRDKLREWLEAHGKTPSRYRHLACHGVMLREMSTPMVPAKRSNCVLNSTFQQDSKDICGDAEREAVVNKKAVVEMLSEVLLLAREGFPTEQLICWIQRVSEKIPFAVSLARYWSLKAYLAALGSGGKTAALKVLEEAHAHNVTPSEELEKVRALIYQDLFNSPFKRLANEVQSENVFESSAIKFSLKKVPVPMPNNENADASVPRSLRKSCQLPQNVIITPVRRSTRKSCGHLPVGLRDHDVIIESVDEIPAEDRPVSLFRSNVALDLQWKFAESESAAASE